MKHEQIYKFTPEQTYEFAIAHGDPFTIEYGEGFDTIFLHESIENILKETTDYPKNIECDFHYESNYGLNNHFVIVIKIDIDNVVDKEHTREVLDKLCRFVQNYI